MVLRAGLAVTAEGVVEAWKGRGWRVAEQFAGDGGGDQAAILDLRAHPAIAAAGGGG